MNRNRATGLRGFERREAGTEVYYKLAAWDDRRMTWAAGKVTFATSDEAAAAARKPGRYRVSTVGPGGWTEEEPFTIGPALTPAP